MNCRHDWLLDPPEVGRRQWCRRCGAETTYVILELGYEDNDAIKRGVQSAARVNKDRTKEQRRDGIKSRFESAYRRGRQSNG